MDGQSWKPGWWKKVYGCPVDLIAHGVPHRVLRGHEEGKLVMEAILKYNFLQNAIMAAILASIVCGRDRHLYHGEKTRHDERWNRTYRIRRNRSRIFSESGADSHGAGCFRSGGCIRCIGKTQSNDRFRPAYRDVLVAGAWLLALYSLR